MCQSLFEGGARCAHHTRPVFEKALQSYLTVRDGLPHRLSWACRLEAAERALLALGEACEAYATTVEGEERLRREAAAAQSADDRALARTLLTAALQGIEVRAVQMARTLALA